MNAHIDSNLDYRSVADALACQIRNIFHDFTDEDKLAIAKYINRIWTADVLKEFTAYMEIEEARKQYNTACDHRYLVTPFSEELKMDQHIIDLLNSYQAILEHLNIQALYHLMIQSRLLDINFLVGILQNKTLIYMTSRWIGLMQKQAR